MEATALHDYDATAEDELSFKKGSILKILNLEEENSWYMAEQDAKSGLIPNNYMEITSPRDWYCGRISRAKAEEILSLQPHDGAFLIRVSESKSESFRLSLTFRNTVLHYIIVRL